MSDSTGTICLSCNQENCEVLLASCPDYVTGERFTIQRCNSCELRWTEPQPESLDRFYSTHYRNYTAPVRYVLRLLYSQRIRSWHALFQNPGTVLEVGCGQGFMLSQLKNLGWQVRGVERNELAAAEAERVLGQKIYLDGFAEISRDDSFDLIVLFQVLEHMNDPLDLLRNAEAHLASGGRIVIGVPNAGSWQARLFGASWFHLDVPRHLFHFTPTSLETLLAKFGLSIEQISYTSWEHDYFGWLQSSLNALGFRQNKLTLLLMRMAKPSLSDFLSCILLVVLAVPSLLVMLVSWAVGKGAMMNVVVARNTPNQIQQVR